MATKERFNIMSRDRDTIAAGPSANLTAGNIASVADVIAAQEKSLSRYKVVAVLRSRAKGGIVDHLQVEMIWAETAEQARIKYAVASPDCVNEDPRGIWSVEVCTDVQ